MIDSMSSDYRIDRSVALSGDSMRLHSLVHPSFSLVDKHQPFAYLFFSHSYSLRVSHSSTLLLLLRLSLSLFKRLLGKSSARNSFGRGKSLIFARTMTRARYRSSFDARYNERHRDSGDSASIEKVLAMKHRVIEK